MFICNSGLKTKQKINKEVSWVNVDPVDLWKLSVVLS
jgi:hypothetical protein